MTDTGELLVPGTRLGELTIERVLGAGGFGVTYLARDESLRARRALKEYLPREWGTRRGDGTVGPRTGSHAGSYAWGLSRFAAEARTLAQFEHRNIVRVERWFEALGTAYMVMEFVEGRTLRQAAEAEGRWSEPRWREVLSGLIDGLSVVHEKEVLHRDIKPDNVMLRADGTPVLIDFGAARQALGSRTQTLQAVLTPGYAPFEQYRKNVEQGPWTDIYALGALSYWALSGEAPDEAPDRIMDDRVRPLSEAAPGRVSGAMSAAVMAALAVAEKDRPPALEAWRKLLDVVPEPLPAPPPPPGRLLFGAEGNEAVRKKDGGPWWTAPSWWTARPWLRGAVAAGLLAAALPFLVDWPESGTVADPALGGPAAEMGGPAPETGEPPPVPPPAEEPVEPPAPPPATAASEAGLGLDRAGWWRIELGLASAGLEPGILDGAPGEAARQALREWQATRGQAATGHLDAASAAALQAAGDDPRPGTVFRECESCPEMVVQPGGELSLGRYEVTRGEYVAFALATGGGADDCLAGASWRDPGFVQTDRHPVVCVSWDDAQAYLQWLSRTTGAAYRLPSDAEWGRAAPESPDGCGANGRYVSQQYTCPTEEDTEFTAPVGSYAADGAGLFDMLGNVWEWTQGCFENDCGRRVLRGGSWSTLQVGLGPESLEPAGPGARDADYGFRVARTLGAAPSDAAAAAAPAPASHGVQVEVSARSVLRESAAGEEELAHVEAVVAGPFFERGRSEELTIRLVPDAPDDAFDSFYPAPGPDDLPWEVLERFNGGVVEFYRGGELLRRVPGAYAWIEVQGVSYSAQSGLLNVHLLRSEGGNTAGDLQVLRYEPRTDQLEELFFYEAAENLGMGRSLMTCVGDERSWVADSIPDGAAVFEPCRSNVETLETFHEVAAVVRTWGGGLLDDDPGAQGVIAPTCATCPAVGEDAFAEQLSVLQRASERINPDSLSVGWFASSEFDVLDLHYWGAGDDPFMLAFARRQPDGAWRAVYGRTLSLRLTGDNAFVEGFVPGSHRLLRVSLQPCFADSRCEVTLDLEAAEVDGAR